LTDPTVEEAITGRLRAPTTFHTFGQGKPFVLERIDRDGIVLLLGQGRHYTPLSWDCLEDVLAFLKRSPGWVEAGGTYVVGGARGTLDEPLKACITRQTSRWVAVVLQEAGIVDVDRGPPLRVKLTASFGRGQ
jgi:hypothetical protein